MIVSIKSRVSIGVEGLDRKQNYNDLSSGDGYYDHFTQGYGDALSTVENEPTADVAEVVRCKECKFYSVNGHCGVLGFCEPDEFCSRGERRKDNAEIH